MRRIVRFVLAMSMLTATACSGNDSSNGAGTASESSSLAGSWTGTWRSDSGVGGAVVFDLAQNGNTLSGTAKMTGSVCLESAKIDGIVDGDDVEIDVTAGDSKASVHLTQTTSNDLAGTYAALAVGICSGDTGSVNASR
ncbi:MAG TPA: hypothetical protein VF407_08785 [Polyangiaceae bacterium]